MSGFTHLDRRGHAHMVDVAGKAVTRRVAEAEGTISMSRECFEAIRDSNVKKGDVLAVARVAGIMGAKKTPDLIPLCHQVALKHVSVEFELDEERHAVHVRAVASCQDVTGVEMEALTAVSCALLAIYDMCKAIDRSMEIGGIHLVSKSGGRSGTFVRQAAP